MDAEKLEELLCEPIYGVNEIQEFEKCSRPKAYRIIDACVQKYKGRTDRGNRLCTRASYLAYKGTDLDEELKIVAVLRKPGFEGIALAALRDNLDFATIDRWYSCHAINEQEYRALQELTKRRTVA